MKPNDYTSIKVSRQTVQDVKTISDLTGEKNYRVVERLVQKELARLAKAAQKQQG